MKINSKFELNNNKIIGTSLLSAVASSLCCITPILALISGSTGYASTFSWLEPFRPYFIGFTILVLGVAWYQKLNPQNAHDCDCENNGKPSFFQSKLFLGIVTIFAIIMTLFPHYSSVFYPNVKKEIGEVKYSNINTINLEIKGMTCTSCEKHIIHSVNQLNGIINISSSYKNGNAEIKFDNSKTTINKIENAINLTGYSVINIKEK